MPNKLKLSLLIAAIAATPAAQAGIAEAEKWIDQEG